jgi:hypothetical protein
VKWTLPTMEVGLPGSSTKLPNSSIKLAVIDKVKSCAYQHEPCCMTESLHGIGNVQWICISSVDIICTRT